MSELIFEHRHVEANGDIIEMRIWRVPASGTNPRELLTPAYTFAKARDCSDTTMKTTAWEKAITISTSKTKSPRMSSLTNGKL